MLEQSRNRFSLQGQVTLHPSALITKSSRQLATGRQRIRQESGWEERILVHLPRSAFLAKRRKN